MRTGLGRIDAVKTAVPVNMRKNAVMLPALPKLIKKNEILFPIVLRPDIGHETAGHTGRVEQDTIRV